MKTELNFKVILVTFLQWLGALCAWFVPKLVQSATA
jgi:hypothetical protein